MWALVIFGLLAGATASRPASRSNDVYVWQYGNAYHYSLQAKSLVALHQVSNDFVGILWRGNFTVQRRNDSSISVKFTTFEYAEVNHHIDGGWSSPIVQEDYHYKQLALVMKQFDLGMNGTYVTNFTADGNAPTWERNIGKAIATALNIDTMGTHAIEGPTNPFNPYAVFTNMESGVTGRCYVRYAINAIPKYIALRQPQLGHTSNWQDESILIDISKSTNYSRCSKRPVSHVGLGSQGSFKVIQNLLGKAISVTTNGRAIISGSLNNYRVQYSSTATQLMVYPLLYRQQKGMSGSEVSIRLEKLEPSTVPPPVVDNAVTSPDLVYEYSQKQELRKVGSKFGQLPDDSGSSSSDSEGDSEGSSSSNESDTSNESSKSDESDDSKSKSSSSSSEEQGDRRFRRSLKRYGPDHFRRQLAHEDSSSDSSSESVSSSEEALQHLFPKSYLHEAPVFPFHRMYLGSEGQPLTNVEGFDVIGETVRILREIGAGMICTGQITTLNIHEKFVRVRNLLRLLNDTDMLKVSDKVQPGPSASQEANNTWTAFIHASTQTGTKPALATITSLINKGVLGEKLQGQALAFLGRYAIFPSRDYIEAFWKLLQSPAVKSLQSVYSTGTLAFTDMLYMATQATDVTGDLENVYGKHIEEKDKNIADEYVEKLEVFLRQSLSVNNTHEIQLYIRSIGNIGSDKVYEVFDPYFNGDVYSSNFQRQSMVMAFENLGLRNNTLGLKRLYEIISSPGEDSAVRSLSCFMFMKFNPTLTEMAKVAQYLRYEQDKHVISAYNTALLAASKLEGPEYEHLARDAQAATKVMSSNITGIQRSSEYWINHEVSELNLEYEAKLFILGSRDTILPKGVVSSATRRQGGFKNSLGKVAGTVSSFRDLVESISEQIISDYDFTSKAFKLRPEPRSGPISFTLDDINKHFKIKTDIKEALEAVYYSDVLNTPTLFTRDNKTISYFAEDLKKLVRNAGRGLDFDWTKFVVTDQVHFGLPNSLGLPTGTTLVKPLILTINGNITATTTPDITKNSPENKVLKPQTIKANIRATIAVSTMARGDISLVFPYKDSTVYVAGYKEKTLLNVPIEATIYIDLQNNFLSIKIVPLREHEKQRVLHLCEVPYVYVQQVADLSQPQLNIIHKRRPTEWSQLYGQSSTGLAFQVDYRSEMLPGGKKPFYSVLEENPLKRLILPFTHSEIALRNISVFYDPHQSSANSVVVRGYYVEQRNTAEDSGLRRPHPRSFKRTEFTPVKNDLLQAALSGIQHGEGSVVNVSVEFEGPKSSHYSFAVATASSPVDTTSRLLARLYWQNVTATKLNKALFNITGDFPPVPVMSLDNVNPNGTAIIRLNTTQGMDISATVDIVRTLPRQQYIENAPLTHLCKGQMEKGNRIQFTCRNSTIMKYFLNKYYLTGSYSNVSPVFANATYKVYQYFFERYFPLTSVNVVNATGKPGKFAAWATISPDRTSANFSVVVSNVLNSNITNVRLSRFAATLLMTHPRFSTKDAALNMLTRGQANATCAIDRSLVNSLDNSTYSVKIGDCWTVVFITARRRNANGTEPTPGTPQGVVVLIRSTGENTREVKILSGYDEVICRPISSSRQGANPPFEIIVNGQKTLVSKGQYKTVNGRDQALLLTAYGEYDSLAVNILGMTLNFDGQRLLLQPDDYYRDSIRGLCGTFDGHRKTDLKVPRNCILGNETTFVQEYVYPKGCKTPVPIPIPLYNICVKEVIIVGNNTLEPEIVPGIVPLPGSQGGDDDVDVKNDRFMEYQTLVKEFAGKSCFSVRPVRKCNDQSEPTGETEEKVTFHCVAKSEAASKWSVKARRGEVLDFLLKKKGHSSHAVSLPTACKPLH